MSFFFYQSLAEAIGNPLLHYSMDDAYVVGNTIIDQGSGRNNGTVVNGPLTGVTGQIANARSLNGTTQHINNAGAMAAAAANTTGTVSFWYKKSVGSVGTVIFLGNNVDSGNLFRLAFTGATTLQLLLKGTVTDYYRGTVTITDDGNWHHVLAVGGPDGNKLYVDNVRKTVTYTTGSASVTNWLSSLAGTTNFRLGFDGDGVIGSRLSGSVDDVRIYNRALSPGEVAALYAYTGSAGNEILLSDLLQQSPALGLATTVEGEGEASLTAEQGSFTLTGQDTGLRVARLLTAAAASHTLTGQNTSLLVQRSLTAAAGSFTLTGNAALKFGRRLAADTGSFTLTGNAAAVTRAARLTADQGTFTLTGEATGLVLTGDLNADTGSFTVTGPAIQLLTGRRLVAETASFALTGTATGLTATRVLTATGAVFTNSGAVVELRMARYTLTTAGNFLLLGSTVTLTRDARLTAAAGGFTCTGIDVVFDHDLPGDNLLLARRRRIYAA